MNAIISNILNAQPHISFDDGFTLSRISCNGHKYVGVAELHQEDRDFNSEIVGSTIATSRARISALKIEVEIAEIELRAKREMYWHGTKGMEVYAGAADPFRGFYRSVQSTERKLYNLRRALRSEERALNNYLKNHKEAISKLKSYRAEKAENN